MLGLGSRVRIPRGAKATLGFHPDETLHAETVCCEGGTIAVVDSQQLVVRLIVVYQDLSSRHYKRYRAVRSIHARLVAIR